MRISKGRLGLIALSIDAYLARQHGFFVLGRPAMVKVSYSRVQATAGRFQEYIFRRYPVKAEDKTMRGIQILPAIRYTVLYSRLGIVCQMSERGWLGQ